MSKFICFIFRITSFAFLLLSLAFIFPQSWLPLVMVATLLMLLSLIIIIFAQKEATESAIRIETFDNIDDQAGWIITVHLFFMLNKISLNPATEEEVKRIFSQQKEIFLNS